MFAPRERRAEIQEWRNERERRLPVWKSAIRQVWKPALRERALELKLAPLLRRKEVSGRVWEPLGGAFGILPLECNQLILKVS